MANAGKPDLPEGYLGAQGSFGDLGLSVSSHSDPCITIRENHLDISFNCSTPVKFTHQLINCATEKENNEYVFTHTKDKTVVFVIQLPEIGYYKLQLFALPVTDESKSLPNVFNYLIHCTRAVQPVYPYPKQYAQWKEGCFLYKPLILHNDSKLTNIQWSVQVPHAKGVAVVADGEWFHFENRGGPIWDATFSLDNLRGKNAKITLNANLSDDETKYCTLLEYKL
ncbi:uncharacterized protein LOC132558077 [Ylistrum balloti]|uniref:uncharacterized protein LOC132558077 n=1 Tax=Ylistrum balloti TaxID=509963 RepID=UPI0029057E77|nr:uncharacterized protein LOC132558077 [Ylistrum balloti]